MGEKRAWKKPEGQARHTVSNANADSSSLSAANTDVGSLSATGSSTSTHLRTRSLLWPHNSLVLLSLTSLNTFLVCPSDMSSRTTTPVGRYTAPRPARTSSARTARSVRVSASKVRVHWSLVE